MTETIAQRPDDGRLPPVADRRGRAGGAAQRVAQGRLAASRRRDPSHHDRRLRRPRAPARVGAGASSASRDGDRVATLMWNQPEHLEAYFAIPSIGRGDPHAEPAPASRRAELHRRRRGGLRDRSSTSRCWRRLRGSAHAREFKHVIVVSQRRPVPDGTIDYESLIESHEPMQWPALERASRGGHVLHVGHDRAAQGRGVLAPGARAALADGCAAGLERRLGARHDPPGGADVPRQRVGPAVHRHVRRRGARAARARSSMPRACST